MSKERFDIHQHLTDRIVAAIEAGAGPWQMPWHRGSGGRHPVNIASGNKYRGVNVLALWVEAQVTGYGSHVWGTYRQWAEKGASVRKGQKASYIVFYRQTEVEAGDDAENESKSRVFARAAPVFNAEQVDGSPQVTPAAPVEDLHDVDGFVARTGAKIVHGGNRACFVPKLDEIHMPRRELFTGSATSTPTEAYYSTLLHELTHWTALPHRCDRDLSGRFGTDSYAMEELVAELGAAFLCAELGIAVEPRADHAQYLAHWLNVLKADKRAIFTAASKAGEALSFLQSERPAIASPLSS
ncbi:ArdC family protein [Bradyrhizobium pachyrhizi]|uniref:ArdC family protein n=1 Tax=Bradyrhizobium pachyrhizi TaxID=280333 RepID=UPI00067B3769|nr:zincin-like metallopeptidase domain-containing protein [Bradyrhizobium pachyrhizi]